MTEPEFPTLTPAWQRKRALALHRIFSETAARTATGEESAFRAKALDRVLNPEPAK